MANAFVRNTELVRADEASETPGFVARNLKDPIKLTGVLIHGIAAEFTPAGQTTANIWRRMATTSDSPIFHGIVENLARAIEHVAGEANSHVSISNANHVLLVIHKDNTADLWVDGAAVAIQMISRRDMVAGSVVFQNDIADVTGMWFPCVKFEPTDRVIYIFREAWRFGLFFDLTEELSVESARRTLGSLYRNMRYSHLYDMLTRGEVFERLISAGWFPFVEIINGEFSLLLNSCEAEASLDSVEGELLAKFTPERIDQMLARWLRLPHFAQKEAILREALEAFKANRPITAIKLLLTEIEGILANAHRAATGQPAGRRDLLKFAIASAEQKAGAPDTLLFSAAFARYLDGYTFANFDPLTDTGTAGSRHAVGHGAAQTDSYTQAHALQAILTLDQLALYT